MSDLTGLGMRPASNACLMKIIFIVKQLDQSNHSDVTGGIFTFIPVALKFQVSCFFVLILSQEDFSCLFFL